MYVMHFNEKLAIVFDMEVWLRVAICKWVALHLSKRKILPVKGTKKILMKE